MPATASAMRAAKDRDAAALKAALALPEASGQDFSPALFEAAFHGRPECVRILIPACDCASQDSRALRIAAELGCIECLAMLIPVTNPLSLDSAALGLAADFGDPRSVALLIPVSNPKALNSEALRRAAGFGHAECVALLIPVSDPKAGASEAPATAATHGQKRCVELLAPFSSLADFDKASAAANEWGHPELAAMIDGMALSLSENKALAAIVPRESLAAPAQRSSRGQRAYATHAGPGMRSQNFPGEREKENSRGYSLRECAV